MSKMLLDHVLGMYTVQIVEYYVILIIWIYAMISMSYSHLLSTIYHVFIVLCDRKYIYIYILYPTIGEGYVIICNGWFVCLLASLE